MNPNYRDAIAKVPSALKAAMGQLCSAHPVGTDHKSADAAEIFLAAFQVADRALLGDDWDYYAFNDPSLASKFFDSVAQACKGDVSNPVVILAERVDSSYKHARFWACTLGLSGKNYLASARVEEANSSYSEGWGDVELFSTDDPPKSFARFLHLSGKPKSPKAYPILAGASMDTGVEVGSDEIEQVDGYIVYAFPIRFPAEASPWYGSSAGLKFNMETARPAAPVLAERAAVITESLGAFTGTEHDGKAELELYFENGSLAIPKEHRYDFHVRVTRDGADESVTFGSVAELATFVRRVTGGAVDVRRN